MCGRLGRVMLRRTFLAAAPLAAQVARVDEPFRIGPRTPFPASPILFSFAEKVESGRWMGRTVTFGLDAASKRWVGLAAVGLDTKPGVHVLDLGEGRSYKVRVAPHLYRTGRLTVPPKFVTPPKSVAERIKREQGIKKQVFATRSERMWAGAFGAPTDTAASSPFGTRRTYNGKTQSMHQGLDFRAAVGTPVRAAQRGRVLIAEEMYYEGGFVVLDHGEGLFTLYMHLSKFLAPVGEVMAKGTVLGESGKSGRVTGPHLHFGVQWQGLYMEPGTLLALTIA